MNDTDTPGAHLKVGVSDGSVVLDFDGKQRALPPDRALELARMLVRCAGRAKGAPLTMRVGRVP